MFWWRFALAVLAVFVVQTTALPQFASPAVDLMLMLALWYAWTAPLPDARLTACLTGLVQDVGTQGPLGLHAVACGLTAWLLTRWREHVNRDVWWVRWIVGSAAVLPTRLLVAVQQRYWQGLTGSWPRLLLDVFLTSVIAGLLAALAVGVPTLLRRRRRGLMMRW
jgi:rod shape-determining protein MreD